MKLLLQKEERDYSLSRGLFNSSQIQDVEIYDENKKHLAWLVVNQPYYHTNYWGAHRIEGGVQIKWITDELRDYMDTSYGGFTLENVNKVFKPLAFTKKGQFEKVVI